MFGFFEIVSDVMKVVTFQPNRQPGLTPPSRHRTYDGQDTGHDWTEPMRRGRR
jgi:hypothetical protein